jgi:tetraacyldisaccharide 4'-kinase
MREYFRDWIENVETFILEVIFEERRDWRANLTRGLLFFGSKIFQVSSTFAAGFTMSASAGQNAGRTGDRHRQPDGGRHGQNAGGGKICAGIARRRPQRGHSFARLPLQAQPLHTKIFNKILLREDQTPPRIVSDGKSLLLDSNMAGDEPYMLASNLKDVVVLVDKDRVKSGRYAIEKFGCDTLLLDDGFQYWDLRGRRHDVVLIDRQQPFGNEHLLPRGTLREPPSHLARAHTIFITKSDGNTGNCASALRNSTHGGHH